MSKIWPLKDAKLVKTNKFIQKDNKLHSINKPFQVHFQDSRVTYPGPFGLSDK